MFNFNDEKQGCCPHCGCDCASDNGAELHECEITLDDPTELVAKYFDYFKSEVNSNEDLTLALSSFFNEVYYYAAKKALISDIDTKMQALTFIENYKNR